MISLGSIRRNFMPWTDPSEKPYICFEHITKRFGDFVAVNDFSLEIYRREFFTFIGASGSGKSTILRMLAGFETPDSGRILLDGQDLQDIPPYRRPVNMMFQSYALFPHMSVEKNIEFGLKQDRLPRLEIKKRLEEMLNLFHLTAFAKRKPHQLSGGERQRVALARSIAKRPKVLLLDEPLGALDKKLREKTLFELMDIQQSLGLTFIVVTHDQEEAMAMADRIGVLYKGEILQIATPAEIYEAPVSPFVADFIGNINIFEGYIAKQDDSYTYIDFGQEHHIMIPKTLGIGVGEKVRFFIRPEKIDICLTKAEADKENVLEAEIYDIAYLGDRTMFQIKLHNKQIIQASAMNKKRFSDKPLTWNDRLWISFSSEAGIIFTDL